MVDYGNKEDFEKWRLVTQQELAEKLGFPQKKVQRWTWEGYFIAWKIGNEIRYFWPEVEAMISLCAVKSKKTEKRVAYPFLSLTDFAKKAQKSLRSIHRQPADCCEGELEYLSVQIEKAKSGSVSFEAIEIIEPVYAIRDFLAGWRLNLLNDFQGRLEEERFSYYLADPRKKLPWNGEEFVVRDDNAVMIVREGQEVQEANDETSVKKYLDIYHRVRKYSHIISRSFPETRLKAWPKIHYSSLPIEWLVELIGSGRKQKDKIG